MHDVFHL